jgi:hypothetical protein
MRQIVIALALGSVLFGHGKASQAGVLYGVTGDGGTPTATLHILSQTDASATPVLTLSTNGGGQAIAFNPNDGFMYHWAGYPAGNAVFARIDLNTNSVTNIPLSGFETNEIYSATYDSESEVFLTSDLSFNVGTVTTGGLRTDLANNSVSWVRGLAFVDGTLYGGRNTDAELYTIDPTTGNTIATTTVTMAGQNLFGFNGLATDPDTGTLWALLRAEGLSRKTRILATLDPFTGVATQIGITAPDSGFASIAFAPEPTVIPEPSSLAPWGICMVSVAVGAAGRRRRNGASLGRWRVAHPRGY